ncbi:isopropanol dehydrogenase [Parachaetomium inaequale]|uniref:Isopropanol dehydrogenase n=1 Tax=Parachaetomium inaequale TaxID=2588326 RepID=A0AAN6SMK3_9PEZI|nr:isopropanol dehydrogenase [Parachaetomium inaequale]
MATDTYQAAVLTELGAPLQLETRTIPQPAQGSAVVKVLAAPVLPYMKQVLDGTRGYPLTLPIVPSSSCIARVHAVAGDAVRLRPGQLVLCDLTIRARDQPATTILQGLNAFSAPALMAQWADGSFAEYAVFPLENVFALDEDRLLRRLGYSVEDLCLISACNVAFGGLAALDVKPGEKVVVCPATGRFGGAAVATALAMGARVWAAGRNAETLRALALPYADTGRIETVVLGGDLEQDKKTLLETAGGEGFDCYVDFSPPQAADSNHIQACLGSLRPFGRAVLNGGSLGAVSIPYLELMLKSLRIYGRFMYEREHTVRLIQMVEAGLLPLGDRINSKTVGRFKLDQIYEAMELASKESGWGKQVVLLPQGRE